MIWLSVILGLNILLILIVIFAIIAIIFAIRQLQSENYLENDHEDYFTGEEK